MKVCEKCGAVCTDDATYCNMCGTPLNAAQPAYQQNPYQPNQQQNPYQQNPYQQNPYQQNPYQQQPPTPPYQPYQQAPLYPPYPQQGVKRKAPLVLGIVGAVFALLLPIVTYCCSIPGLVMAVKDINQGADNRVARTLNLIAIVVAAVNSVLGVVLNLSYFV